MQSSRIFVSLLTVFAIVSVGCTRERQAKELADEGTQRSVVAQANITDLRKEGIELQPTDKEVNVEDTAHKVDWSKFDPVKRKQIAIRLHSHLANTRRLIEIMNHDKIKVEGDKTWIDNSKKNAQFYYDALIKFDKTLAAF